MPRTPRNPGSGKPPSNAPARGPGWGKEAKGAGNGSPPRPVTEGVQQTRGADGRYISEDAEWRREKVDVAIRKYVEIMETSEYEGNVLAATEKFLDRVQGKPKQHTELTGKDGGPLVSAALPTDPVEAARVYQRLVNGG